MQKTRRAVFSLKQPITVDGIRRFGEHGVRIAAVDAPIGVLVVLKLPVAELGMSIAIDCIVASRENGVTRLVVDNKHILAAELQRLDHVSKTVARNKTLHSAATAS